MDELLRHLKQLSADMMRRLDQATVEDFVEFTEKREQVIGELKRRQAEFQPSEETARLVAEISQYDAPLVSRMQQLMREAGDGLARLERSRMQRKAYDAGYAFESAFIDKRK
jgi:hypothetical protein